jgi:hypothetical protein
MLSSIGGELGRQKPSILQFARLAELRLNIDRDSEGFLNHYVFITTRNHGIRPLVHMQGCVPISFVGLQRH